MAAGGAARVEVTRENFAGMLPLVLRAIQDATFIAFDTEFSGLTTSRASRYFVLDNHQQRYEKMRDSATNFGLLQTGLSCFCWDDKKQR